MGEIEREIDEQLTAVSAMIRDGVGAGLADAIDDLEADEVIALSPDDAAMLLLLARLGLNAWRCHAADHLRDTGRPPGDCRP